jgi:hypothetical protein
LQTQIYVSRRETELSEAVLISLQTLHATVETIRWVAPLETTKFYEPRDSAFLKAVGLQSYAKQLSAFWPSRGPRWDALAVMQPGNAVLLVEGKSYPAEMLGGGCKASKAARTRIESSLSAAKARLNAHPDADWLGQLYQFANRLAHVHFLRDVCGAPAYLANLCFVGDPHCATSEADWRTQLRTLKTQLGFSHEIPYCIDVFLEARTRQELTGRVTDCRSGW